MDTQLIGRHFPSQHGTVVIQRESIGRLRRGAQAHDDLVAKARHELIESIEHEALERELMCLPIQNGTVIEFGYFLHDDDIKSGRSQGPIVQRRYEQLELKRIGANTVGIQIVPVVAMDSPQDFRGDSAHANVRQKAGKRRPQLAQMVNVGLRKVPWPTILQTAWRISALETMQAVLTAATYLALRGPVSISTSEARPSRTTMRLTMDFIRICPPSESNCRANSLANACEPPRG